MSKETKRINFVIDAELANKLQVAADERGISRTALLVRWLKSLKIKKEGE